MISFRFNDELWKRASQSVVDLLLLLCLWVTCRRVVVASVGEPDRLCNKSCRHLTNKLWSDRGIREA